MKLDSGKRPTWDEGEDEKQEEDKGSMQSRGLAVQLGGLSPLCGIRCTNLPHP